jgi:hypothetical protein
MDKKHMKKCSASLANKKMQIKTTLRFCLTPFRMVSSRTQATDVDKDVGEKGILTDCWWEYKLVQPLWKTVWRFLKKLKIELPYDPAIPLLGIYPKECKSGFS